TLGIPEVGVIDVSFISLKLMLPPLHAILKEEGVVIALIKPQFEAGREAVGKIGIVRDPQTHQKVLEDILSFAAQGG
ncbi:SAM-dependent methyltransferase, partial [Enterococcus faecium]|uniref:SAM-dependent methyltransferase n=1 Tax=Enterococcus faecium TaxID=1352 RepID=UPI003CC6A0EB